MIKQIFNFIKVYSICFGYVYLLFSFVQRSFNFDNWNGCATGLFTAINIAIAFVIIIMTDDNNHEKQ